MEILKDLTPNQNISEEELYKAIQSRVKQMLESKPELLMSYLYRLDILEEKIQGVLNNKAVETVSGLSKLIFERQLERIATKEKYKQGPIDGWDW